MLGVNKYQNQTMLATKCQLSDNETVFFLILPLMAKSGRFCPLLNQLTIQLARDR